MKWFSTQVDRDFITREYGQGIRLYVSPHTFVEITGISYNDNDNELKVQDLEGNDIILKDEPYFDMFDIFHQRWKDFDDKIGQYDEDRTDYEPYVHKSRRALAIELK